MGPRARPGSRTEEKNYFLLPEFEPRTILLLYRDADKSLDRPGRKQAIVSVRMA